MPDRPRTAPCSPPPWLATAIGIAAGAIAARLGYRRVRLSA
jgi:hypothetical protein